MRTALALLAAALVFQLGAAGSEPPAAAPALGPNEPKAAAALLEARIQRDPDDTNALNRLAAIYLQRLRVSGDLSWLERAAAAARQSLKSVPGELNTEGLAAQAHVDFESHRFAAARDGAKRLAATEPGKAEGFLILGDALLELGDLDQALAAWRETMTREGASKLDLEMRQARLAWLRGQTDQAKAGFARALALAADPLAPQPAAALWCRVQRGQMAFSLGDWKGAEEDYLAAQALNPESYAVAEHLAELCGAKKEYPEAEARYEKIIAQTGGRPEFMQALGDVYLFAGQAAEAKTWHDRALAAYLKRAADGSVMFDHHLAGFYCDVQPDPDEALKWAQRDSARRHSGFACDALAWALYQNGDWPGAVEAAQKALAIGTPDAHIIYHAAMIYSRSGDLARGNELLRRVAVVNPHYFNSFHAHR